MQLNKSLYIWLCFILFYFIFFILCLSLTLIRTMAFYSRIYVYVYIYILCQWYKFFFFFVNKKNNNLKFEDSNPIDTYTYIHNTIIIYLSINNISVSVRALYHFIFVFFTPLFLTLTNPLSYFSPSLSRYPLFLSLTPYFWWIYFSFKRWMLMVGVCLFLVF